MSTLLGGRLGTVPIILTRWVVVVAISYAIIISAEGVAPFWPHQVFIAAILLSNLVLAWILSRSNSWQMMSGWATALDIAAISMAISVARNVSTEFYLVYFSILILAAVVDRRSLLILLTVIACASYGILVWVDAGGEASRGTALLVRLPVLFFVALYFGTAVQNARREVQRQAEQLNVERQKALSALTEMGNVALAGGYPGPVLYELAGWVQEIVEFDRCSLLVFGEGGERGYLAASGDDPSIEVMTLEMGDYPELGPVLERGEFTEIHPGTPADLWEEVQANLPAASPFKTFIVVPIKRANGVIGAFYLRDSDGSRSLSEAQTSFCFQAAQMAAAFIYEHDLLATLEAKSTQDSLTGLMNYRDLILEAERLVRENGDPVSIAVVNIDNLRGVNREHGHETGTDLISRIGTRLVGSLGGAAVSRYGGDEFVVAIETPAVDVNATLQEKFLDALPAADNDLLAGARVSIGIAASPEHGDNAESILEAAQEALRSAKRAGGHRIIVAPAP